MRRFFRCCLGAVALAAAAAAQTPEKIKVVVVTMFERGNDTGDAPGEFQFWVEREKLDKVYENRGSYHPVRGNGKGLLAMVTGVGTARAAASVMNVANDPRWDFREAYWVIAGIAGVDPEDASVGSAAWAEWVADSDLAFELDAREIPVDWPFGIKPLTSGRQLTFQLDPALTEWAYQFTRRVALDDTEGLRKMRARYTGYPNGQKPPFVLKGDSLSGGRFWHGAKMNSWANVFLREASGGKANFVTTAMEDSGTIQSLLFLGQAGKVDTKRILVLRTASNYSMQPPGMTAAESWQSNSTGHYSGYRESLEAAYRVASPVVRDLLNRK
jgi:purine nucleoside permease